MQSLVRFRWKGAPSSVDGEQRYAFTGARGGSPPGAIEVETVRLDTHLKGKVDVVDMIKVDVEGAEMHLLRGMGGLLSTCKAVLMDIHPGALVKMGSSVSETLRYLQHHGFYVLAITREGLKAWDGAEDVKRVVAIPNDSDLINKIISPGQSIDYRPNVRLV